MCYAARQRRHYSYNFNLIIMDIKINLVEIASELANDRTFEELTSEYMGETEIYKTDSDVVEYTDYAQRVFNNWYDYYYNFINIYKID